MAHRWSKDGIASEILRMYAAHEKLNSGTMQTNHVNMFCAAIRHFGSWQKAIEFAGLSYDEVRLYQKGNRGGRWSKDEIALEILRLYAAREELNYVSVQNKHAGLLRAAKRYFGSWQEAMEYAGLNYDEIRRYRVWTEDKIIQRIRKYYREGKDLRWRHVSTVLDPPLAAAAIRNQRFGTWRKALEAAGIDPLQFYRTPATIRREG